MEIHRAKLHWPAPTVVPSLAEGEVHVWAVPLDDIRAPWPALDASLSRDEQERAHGFVREQTRKMFIATRTALRAILGRHLACLPAEVSFVENSVGKPRLAQSDLHFNVAHSGTLGLLAVTRGCEIGVDLEYVRPFDELRNIAERNFHPREQAVVRAGGDTQRIATFFRCWARKEAVLKAIGTGLGYPLDQFEAMSQPSAGGWVDLPADSTTAAIRCWLQDINPCGDYAAAVATIDQRRPPLGFTYSLERLA